MLELTENDEMRQLGNMEFKFCVVGLDHERAPLSVRKRFAFSASQKIELSFMLMDMGCKELVILSTCNRSELYFSSGGFTPEAAIEAFCAFFDADKYRGYFFGYCGDEALRHLFSVTAGLQSALIGEDQILGQVREAAEFAELSGSSGKLMTKIFRSAVTAAKQIKTETGISGIPVSASYIGMKKLDSLLGGLAGKSVLVIGTGEMSMLAAKSIAEKKPQKLYICSRTRGKDLPLEKSAFELIPYSERYSYVAEADAVITATSSPHAVLEGARMPKRQKPLYIVDMALPPDVDDSVYGLEKIKVINIDELGGEATENLLKRKQLSECAEGVIEERLLELRDWLLRSRVDTALESLSKRCDEIAAETESFLENKLELGSREKKLVYKMLEASLRRLIREPVLRLKELDDEGKQDEYINVVKELFGVK